MAVSQTGPKAPRAVLLRGTLVPQSRQEVVRAGEAAGGTEGNLNARCQRRFPSVMLLGSAVFRRLRTVQPETEPPADHVAG